MAQAIQSRGPVTGTAVTTKKRRKFFLLDLYGTAVGKKYAMAISGIMLVGFVLVHMVGNLKMYLGAEDFNHYAEFLRELLEHRKTTIVARPRASADKTRLLYLANKASNNLNQLAHRVNADHLAGKVSDSTYQVVLANLVQLGADLREAVRHVD